MRWTMVAELESMQRLFGAGFEILHLKLADTLGLGIVWSFASQKIVLILEGQVYKIMQPRLFSPFATHSLLIPAHLGSIIPAAGSLRDFHRDQPGVESIGNQLMRSPPTQSLPQLCSRRQSRKPPLPHFHSREYPQHL